MNPEEILLVVKGMSLAIDLLGIADGYERLREGLAAKAEKEGREMNADEEAFDDALVAASEKARDGQ